MNPLWAVILNRPEHTEPVALAKALAAARRTPLQDQVLVAQRAWGILWDALSQEEARTRAGILTGSGISCEALPAGSLAVLPEARPLTRFDPNLTAGLTLLAAAAVTVSTTTTRLLHEGPSAGQKLASAGIFLATGIPIKIGGKKRTVEKTHTTSDLALHVDLIYQDPPKRLRINAERFDYSFLKERRLYQSLANFRLLLADLAQAASVWRNWGARVLLASQPVQTMGYESLADLDRESRWLLTLHARPPKK